MAWYDGVIGSAAGDLNNILATDLVLNANWHVEDAGAGADIGVYHCLDAANNVDFILWVDDDQANYAEIALWEGWDSGTHTGTGVSLYSDGTYVPRIRKIAGGYGLSVRDHCFVFVSTQSGFGNYVGETIRADDSFSMPIIISHDSAAAIGTMNPLGFYGGGATKAYWRCMRDHASIQRFVFPHCLSATSTHVIKDFNGNYWLTEWPVYFQTINRLLGFLEGVMYFYNGPNDLVNNDLVDVAGQDWLAVVSTYYNLVEKA